MAQNNDNCSKGVYRKLSKKSRELLGDVYSNIYNYRSIELPDLQEIFQPEAIDYLLGPKFNGSFVDLLIEAGYKDVPKVDENGEPILRRTTALHDYANKYAVSHIDTWIRKLFKIYARFDVNYADKFGITHFHLACEYGCVDEVKKFLEVGQDPNYLTNKGVSPLIFALSDPKVFELLLRAGANPNSGGMTPLHHICQGDNNDDLAKMIFELSNEKYRPVQVNTRDKLGNAPLYYALMHSHDDLVELLLKNGADPNLANEKGLRPLHITLKKIWCTCNDGTDVKYLLEMFFKINKELDQPVQVDARDDLGRTPLEYAVARLLPEAVDVLLDHGADLSSFVFPPASHFREMSMMNHEIKNYQLRIATGLLAVVESLEKRGYELDRKAALTIRSLFAKYGLIDSSSILPKYWYEENTFKSEAKSLTIVPNLSVYDWILMRPEEASKRLAYSDYYRFARRNDFKYIPDEVYEAYVVHMGEKISKVFFARVLRNDRQASDE
ncbi:unnamed protein product [Trichogramma brassicae]|uniref:Uncharacterized protein n=1 Tax=Trichogramma brassicae TaxID=86971 RepID=A0A6H5IEW9_9HYME|nr:unnamed protein product [Trichogramma brassicae]